MSSSAHKYSNDSQTHLRPTNVPTTTCLGERDQVQTNSGGSTTVVGRNVGDLKVLKAVFAGSSKIDLTSHFRTFESEKWSLFAVLPLQAEGHGCEFALRTLSPRGRPRGREPEFGNREGRP